MCTTSSIRAPAIAWIPTGRWSATGCFCVEANLVTTASLLWAADALNRLRRFDQSVRLVRFDGHIFTVNGWPPEEPA